MADLPVTGGVFLPNKVIKRLEEGAPTVVIHPNARQFTDKPNLLVDGASVVGVITMGEAETLPQAEAVKTDHGYKPAHMKKQWPEAKELTVWPVEFSPLAEPVPLAAAQSLRYGDTFKVQLDRPLITLTPTQVQDVRQARKLARAWAVTVPDYLEHTGAMGPGVGAIMLALPSTAQALQDVLGRFHVQAGERAPGGDFGGLTAELGNLLAKLGSTLPAGDLRQEVEYQAAFNRHLQDVLPFTKRAMPALKLPDPIWMVTRLAQDKEAGFLSGRPRESRAGVDQILVNELRQKEGTPEVYARPFAWAIVRTGEPREVDHDQLAGLPLDSFTRAEWRERRDDQPWFIPVEMVRVLDPPVELREAPPGRRFASMLDLEAQGVGKQALPDPTTLDNLKVDELRRVHADLVTQWEKEFKGNTITQGREDLINAILFTRQEFIRRGMEPPPIPKALEDELGALKADKRATAEIRPGSAGELPPITLPQVLEHMGKPIRLRRGAVTVVGSVCNHGATRNDVDMLISGPIDEGLRRVIEFRLGRSFPGHISQRISFLHDPELGGPFTDHVEAFDLCLVPRGKFDVVEMRAVSKADDPLLDMPPKKGPRQAVLQWHFRGKSLHGDLRIKVGKDYLVGWTMLLQKAGIPAPQTLAEAKRMAATFDPDGGPFNKDFLAPEGIQATTKSRQPVAWLHLEGEFIEPGEVGATRELPGLIVEVPNAPEFAELGVQKPWFHEYFLSGGKVMNGRLMFRLLEQTRQEETDRPFWRTILSKEFLPSVLNRRAVKQKTMPPDGFSWIPVSLEKQTPKEFRYWEHKGAEARKIRDALVEARYFTKDNVRLVNGVIARVEESRKYVLTLPEGVTVADVVKQAQQAKWVLSYQAWKGQQVVRGGPSREVWHLAMDIGGKLMHWELQSDPTQEERIGAIEKPIKGRSLWELEGNVPPGKSFDGDVWNDTKATPSTMTRMDQGTATVLERGPGMIRLRLRGKQLRGVYVLEPEEEGSAIWLFSRSEGPGQPRLEKAGPEMRGDVQVWDPKRIPRDADRTNDRKRLRPPAIFQPMKVAPRKTNEYTDVEEARQIATPENLKAGIAVEPKMAGFRLVSEAWDDKVMIFTEDEKRDLSTVLPGLAAEIKALGVPLILDAEGTALDEEGNPVPRRDLAQFRGKDPVDDEMFRLRVFGLLFDPKDGNQLAASYAEQRHKLEALLKGYKGKRIQLVPRKVARTWDELRKAIEWASKEQGSEGAMFKVLTSTYSLGGENDLWAKYKRTREIAAIVFDRHEVKGSPGVFNLFSAVGPVKDPTKWQETVEIGGKHYTVIGRTGNAKTTAKPGDVIVANVLEVLFERDSKGRQRLRWFGPPTLVTPEPVDRKPFTTDQVIDLLQPGEIKKYVDTVIGNLLHIINKADGQTKEGDPCTVFGEVLVPNINTGEPEDTQGDTYSKADVEEACYSFMQQGHRHGLMHQQYLDGKVVLLENYLMPLDVVLVDMKGKDRTIPEGTWMMKVQILDPELISAVRAGDITGFSVGGSGMRTQVG